MSIMKVKIIRTRMRKMKMRKRREMQKTNYRGSLQFADFGGNENPRITKPRISRTPVFGSKCPLKLYQFLFTMLIGNYLPISIENVAIF